MHIHTIRTRPKGKVYKSHLLRQSHREGDKVRKRTLAVLSALPEPVIELLQACAEGRDGGCNGAVECEDREFTDERCGGGVRGLPSAKASARTHNLRALRQVERAFRAMKTTQLELRPILHRRVDRVRAHAFLCMLAYYVV